MIDLTFDKDHIWHPYTSLTKPLPSYAVASTDGVYINLEDGTRLVDGMSSWWSAIHGYNHPELTKAAKDQIDKMPHVMFGGITHKPAVDLCKKLVDITPKGLDRVFLSDSGSVAVEVAIKMSLQYWMSRGKPQKKKLLTIKHGYHGDTFAAMGICDPVNSMHGLYQGFVAEHYFAEAPKSDYYSEFDYADLDSVKQLFELHHEKIAAFFLEPIVQGAGGMRIYHKQYLIECQKLCQQYDVLFVFDEIATGFGRTGQWFAADHAAITPDIMCVGKAITGGFMSLAATLCTKTVADGICNGEAGVLMHGPTFMGNPLACAVANKSIELLQTEQWKVQVNAIEKQLFEELMPLKKLDKVADVRIIGAIGAVELTEPVDLAQIQKRFVEMGVWIRPFGKLVYIMPQYVIKPEQLTRLTKAMAAVAQ